MNRMDEGSRVRAEVVKVRRHCPLGHKVGDVWEFGEKTPDGLCIYAFLSFSPAWSALRAGGRFSWAEDPDAVHFACPDDGEVVFELRRIADTKK
ncbi:MAG: TIGR04076 family protein [Deltaproteobacteria bacterium]|nr:TIGR04076 family protein [Deltaproteobacteria bacterium]